MLKFRCFICLRKFKKPGALLITPPNIRGLITKRHICYNCFGILFINHLKMIDKKWKQYKPMSCKEGEKN